MSAHELDVVGGPSLKLHAGVATAEIFPEAGGRLGRLDFGDGELLRGPEPGLGWSEWGCFPLAPWSNRLPGGRLNVAGVDVQLPVNWPDGSAIHGLVASRPWNVVRQAPDSATLEVLASEGPYVIGATQTFTLEPARLHLVLSTTNFGDGAVPVGIGIHPWFRHGAIRVSADARWPGEPVPDGPPVPVSGDHDLRALIVPGAMDACFTSLTARDADAPGVRLGWEGPITDVVVYTGDANWTCIEPVTMATNAFGLPAAQGAAHGAVPLDTGDSIKVRYGFDRLI